MLKSKYKNIFLHQDTYWWYKGMQDINESFLHQYLPKKRKSEIKILDAGCGTGAALVYLAKFGEVIGVDISDDAIEFAKKRGKVEKGDIANLPFKSDTFDVVVCLDVLYHKWVNVQKALSEMRRVLKSGGILLLREPAFDWFKSSEDIASQTKHRFTTHEIEKLLGKTFSILRLTYVNFFLFPLAFSKRLPEIIGIKKKTGASDASSIPSLVNVMLYKIFHIEPFLLQYVSFPFGTSVICVAKKNNYAKKN